VRWAELTAACTDRIYPYLPQFTTIWLSA
jgi:hypothetical protein